MPLILPELEDYKGHNGKAPLENATEWKQYNQNGVKGVRETSTMPGSAGSSWYYLRYIDPHNDKQLANPELLKHWMPVDLYVGGPEHAVGHLMYSRIWNNYLYDKGIVACKEPFKKLVHQGMILGENGIKMGKRFPKYVVNPSDIVKKYGADTLRLYEMFMGPLDASIAWSEEGLEGSRKFLDRVYRLITSKEIVAENNGALDKVYNETVKSVTEQIESMKFNTAIAQLMVFVNAANKEDKLYVDYAKGFIQLIAPFAPHLAEELWQTVAETGESISYVAWPTWDESKLVEDEIEIVVQIKGKVRAKLMVAKDLSREELQEVALANEKVKAEIDGKEIVKVIAVPNKLVNIVVK